MNIENYIRVTVAILGITLPSKVFATVCHGPTNKYQPILDVIVSISGLLALTVIVSGLFCLYKYFFTESTSNFSHYFWWLVAALIFLIILSAGLVYFGHQEAPPCPAVPPHVKYNL